MRNMTPRELWSALKAIYSLQNISREVTYINVENLIHLGKER